MILSSCFQPAQIKMPVHVYRLLQLASCDCFPFSHVLRTDAAFVCCNIIWQNQGHVAFCSCLIISLLSLVVGACKSLHYHMVTHAFFTVFVFSFNSYVSILN